LVILDIILKIMIFLHLLFILRSGIQRTKASLKNSWLPKVAQRKSGTLNSGNSCCNVPDENQKPNSPATAGITLEHTG
jgi:hypothetical protein